MAAARKKELDPPTQLRGLAQRIKTSGLPRGALLRGEERYFIERGLTSLLARAAEQGLEISKHDVADPDFQLASLLDDLGANPMFASARCVLVRNADATRTGTPSILAKVGTKPSPFTRSAITFLESQGEGCLVVAGRSIRADHALAKAMKTIDAPVLACRKLWETPPPWSPDPRKAELALWVGTRSGELGLRLNADDCAYIASATGNDLAAIDTQLENVRRGGHTALRKQVEWASGGTPWKVADELLGGDLARGISALESLFRAGFHSDRDGKTEVNPAALSAILFGTLRNKSRQGTLAAQALRQGASLDQAAQEAGANGKPARESLTRMLELRDAQGWEDMYRDVLELERRSRSGPEVGVNDFVALALRHAIQRAPQRAQR